MAKSIKAKSKFEKYFLRIAFIIFVITAPIKIFDDIFRKGIDYEIREYREMFYELWRR